MWEDYPDHSIVVVGQNTEKSPGEIKKFSVSDSSELPLLPGPLWPRMVAPDRALSMG